MSMLFSGFWDAGKNTKRLIGSNGNIRKNYYNIVPPLSILLFLFAFISTILYIFYAVMYTDKLNKSEDIVKKWAGLEPTTTLVDDELDMFRFYEYYKIATDGAIICLLTIIAMCMIYIILKTEPVNNKSNKD